jgi:hypothetical protein
MLGPLPRGADVMTSVTTIVRRSQIRGRVVILILVYVVDYCGECVKRSRMAVYLATAEIASMRPRAVCV